MYQLLYLHQILDTIVEVFIGTITVKCTESAKLLKHSFHEEENDLQSREEILGVHCLKSSR